MPWLRLQQRTDLCCRHTVRPLLIAVMRTVLLLAFSGRKSLNTELPDCTAGLRCAAWPHGPPAVRFPTKTLWNTKAGWRTPAEKITPRKIYEFLRSSDSAVLEPPRSRSGHACSLQCFSQKIAEYILGQGCVSNALCQLTVVWSSEFLCLSNMNESCRNRVIMRWEDEQCS